MRINTPRNGTASRLIAAWAGTAILSLGVLFGASTAMAAPPANTLIGNQATASYLDGNGTQQLATSNLVQTQVQQVGSFTLTADNTKSGAIGNTVYAPHTLTNTGNGVDQFTIAVTDNAAGYTFSRVEVFPDTNGDGLPDSGSTALCSVVPAAVCNVPAQTVAGNGGTFRFVVAYTVPLGATSGASNNASVVGTPLGAFNYPLANITNTDTVTVTSVAAFSATKALAIPSVASPNPPGGSWPAAITSGPRSPASCGTNYTDAVAPAPGCTYAVYTINYQNTGGLAGAFYMSDALPSGFTYVNGSAIWSSAGGTALTEALGGDPAGINFFQSGQTVSARVDSVGPNVAGSISFMVLINSTAAVGISTTNNVATYDAETTGNALPGVTPGTANTNPAPFTVTASYGVVLGSSTGGTSTAADSTAGTPGGTFGTPGPDQNRVVNITSGGSVRFTHNLFNTGNAADTFNLSLTSNTFPAGSVVSYFRADGVTPLLDTNADGIVDGGSIAAAGSTTFVVQVAIPGSVSPAASVTYRLTVRATSAGDSTKFDASGDQVNNVTGILVDLTNSTTGTGVGSVGSGDLGAGPSPQPTTTNSTPAGSGTIFNLFVRNNDSEDEVYSLAASQSASFPGSLPAGWTVKFVNAGGGCAGGAITTVAVPQGSQMAVDACVTPSVNSVTGTFNIYFRVQSNSVASTGVIVSDVKHDAVTVTTANTYAATLTPDNNGQINPAGTVVYAHTLNNTGAQACGPYTLSATQSGSGSGWTYALFLDVNGNGQIDASDTPVSGPIAAGLAVGGSQKILVRVFAPGNATAGLQDTVVVTATFTGAAPNCGAPSATDISTVVTGQIRVVKTQAHDPTCTNAVNTFSAALITGARPDECVRYRVVATNEGTAPITNLSINDAVPNYTALNAAQVPPQCSFTGAVTGAPAYAVSGNTVSCGIATSVPPGGTLQLDFTVRINP